MADKPVIDEDNVYNALYRGLWEELNWQAPVRTYNEQMSWVLDEGAAWLSAELGDDWANGWIDWLNWEYDFEYTN